MAERRARKAYMCGDVAESVAAMHRVGLRCPGVEKNFTQRLVTLVFSEGEMSSKDCVFFLLSCINGWKEARLHPWKPNWDVNEPDLSTVLNKYSLVSLACPAN